VRDAPTANSVGKLQHVHVVEADDVDAELRHPKGNLFGILFAWEASAEAQIDAEKANPLRARIEVTVSADTDMPQFACGFVKPVADVSR
jgi:hypothetical protein